MSAKNPIDLAFWNRYVGYYTETCDVRLRKTKAVVRWLGRQPSGWKNNIKVNLNLSRGRGSFVFGIVGEKTERETLFGDVLEVGVPDIENSNLDDEDDSLDFAKVKEMNYY